MLRCVGRKDWDTGMDARRAFRRQVKDNRLFGSWEQGTSADEVFCERRVNLSNQ
jgi:hypothetical protein